MKMKTYRIEVLNHKDVCKYKSRLISAIYSSAKIMNEQFRKMQSHSPFYHTIFYI